MYVYIECDLVERNKFAWQTKLKSRSSIYVHGENNGNACTFPNLNIRFHRVNWYQRVYFWFQLVAILPMIAFVLAKLITFN